MNHEHRATRARLGRQRSAATACLTAFMVPVTMFGWFTADAAAAVWNGQERVDVQAAPKAPHQVAGTAGYDPRTLPGLPAQPGTGPMPTGLDGVTLDGSLGLSTSLAPTLSWPGGPTTGVTFAITDFAGKAVWSQRVDASSARVSPNRLKQGGVYQWTATAGGRTFGPHLVRVDVQRAAVQGLLDYGGIKVTQVTGEPVVAFATRALATVAGGASVTLSYRPTDAAAITRTVGVPAGWTISSSDQTPWVRLRHLSADHIELVRSNGEVVPFRQASPGAWVANWGRGQAWPSGQYSTLSQTVSESGTTGGFQMTDRSGVVTTFPATPAGKNSWPDASWSAKAPTMRTTFDADGRMTALTDPVSGRRITLSYGGSGVCPTTTAAGLQKAPAGMLCRIHGWDGGTTAVLYRAGGATPQIGRIIGDAQAAGNIVAQTDLGWDASGRLAATRGIATNAAIASGVLSAAGITAANADDSAVLTTIAYDSRGRVASVARPAALRAGVAEVPERGRRDITYPSPGAMRVTSPGRDMPVSETAAAPQTMLMRSARDSGGRLQTTTWDAARQAPLQMVQPGGLTTKYEYDAQGTLVAQAGPSTTPGSGTGPRVRYAYDTQLPVGAGPSTPATPIVGLQTTYWNGTDFQGAPAAGSTGPRINGATPATLSYNWPASPTGGAFSARLEGTVTVPASGIASITQGAGATQLWIDGVRCAGACPASLDLAARKPGSALDIRVDVRSSDAGTASVSVQWTPKGGGMQAIPSSALRPRLPQPTATAARDQVRASGSITELTTNSVYSATDPSQIVAATSASGLTNKRTYEPYDPAKGQFGRATGTTSAAKRSSVTAYYAVGEGPAITACPGAAKNQGGLPKSRTVPGGLVTTNAYDSAGNVVGTTSTGGRRTCTTFDVAGAPLRTVITGVGTDGGQAVVAYEMVADGNPLASRVSYPGTPRAPETTTVDLLGRIISVTDTWGTTQSMAYDAEDNAVAMTTRTAGGETTTSNSTYTSDGNPLTISRDGLVLAEIAYQESTGLPIAITYANGASVGLGYDTRGNANTRTIEVGGQTLGDQVTTSPAGRTLARTLSGPATNASWQYAYDRDGRLTSATLAGTVPDGVPTGTWAYTLDSASQRTRITSPLTAAGGYTYAYSATGAITSTSDPRFAGGFTYDALGRARTAGPLTLSYSPTGFADRVSDGSVTEVRDILPDGTQVADSITAGGTTRTTRYSLSGLLLDEAGAITSQMVALPGAVNVQLPPPSRPDGAATWRYGDLLGSVAWQATGSDAPATTAVYDPDGNRLSGAALSTDPARPNLAFGSQPTAPLSIPVTYMGAREYVPALGVFLQPDPLPDSGPTAYGYAGADPINASDPSGHFFLFDGQWWKENGGAVLKIAVSVAVSIAVSAVTAGAASGPALAFVAGVAGGALGGAAGNALGQVAEDVVNGDPISVDGTEVLVSAGIGGAVGVATGAVQAVRVGRAIQRAQLRAELGTWLKSGAQNAQSQYLAGRGATMGPAQFTGKLDRRFINDAEMVWIKSRARNLPNGKPRLNRISEAYNDDGTVISSNFSSKSGSSADSNFGSFYNRLSQGSGGGN